MPIIAGVDEVGRGPLAGPVVAAAVILSHAMPGVKDSKKLTHRQRERWASEIQSVAIAYAYGRAEVEEIDTLNIHHATLLAMKRAIEGLSIVPDEVWVDGLYAPKLIMPAKTIVRGDEHIESIACASILAKVKRDVEMMALSELYPNYGFEKHKGYGTPFHLAQLEKWGPCDLHRRSFAPVSRCVTP